MKSRNNFLLSLFALFCIFTMQSRADSGNTISFSGGLVADISISGSSVMTFSPDGVIISGQTVKFSSFEDLTFGVNREKISGVSSGGGDVPVTALTVPVVAPTIQRTYPEPKVIGEATDPDPDPDPDPEPVETKSISTVTVSFLESAYVYTGKALTPYMTVLDGSEKLDFVEDYTVDYRDNINAGTATVILNGTGSYTGTKTVTFTISAKDLSTSALSFDQDKYIYAGSSVVPGMTVICDGITLTAGTDYEVKVVDNDKVGTATVTITGKGNYSGTVAENFVIIADPQVVINGSAITPTIIGNESTYEYGQYGKVIVTKIFHPINKTWDHTDLIIEPAESYVVTEDDIYVSEPIKYTGGTITKNQYCQYDATSNEVTIRVTFKEDPVIMGIDSHLTETAEMRVYDYRGVLVLTTNVGPDQNVTASMKHLPAGLYIVRINNQTIKIQKR